MAKIESLADLPPWFDRRKYAEASRFGAYQWYEHLNRRRKLLEAFEYRLDRKVLLNEDGQPSFEMNLWRLSWAAEELSAIRHSPLGISISTGVAHSEDFPIKTIRAGDLMRQMDRDTVALRDGACGEEKLRRWSVIADPEAYYGPNEQLAAQPITMDFYTEGRKPATVVQVDLEATDAVLTKAFNIWLKEARLIHRATVPKGRPEKSKSLYTNWARNGLLPYLDLKIWTMETGDQIPIYLFNEAMTEHRSSDSNVAKTTIDIAHKLMLDLTQLRALAEIEGLEAS